MSRKAVVPTTEAGRCLRALRGKHGFSQAELASRMGLNPERGQAYISALEVGRVKDPEFLTVIRFVRACGAKWQEFCDLYAPPPLPEVDTAEIDRTSFSPVDTQLLKQRLRRQVYKYESRTTRWVKGKPMAPEAQKQARKRFEKYRRQYGIIEMAARRFLDHQKFPSVQYFAWLDIVQRIVSVLRRYPKAEWKKRLEPLTELTQQWRLDPALLERLKAVVIKQYRELTV